MHASSNVTCTSRRSGVLLATLSGTSICCRGRHLDGASPLQARRQPRLAELDRCCCQAAVESVGVDRRLKVVAESQQLEGERLRLAGLGSTRTGCQ